MFSILLASLALVAYVLATCWQGRCLLANSYVSSGTRTSADTSNNSSANTSIDSYITNIDTASNTNKWFFHILCGLAVLSHGWLLHTVIDVGFGQNLSFVNILSQVCWFMVVILWVAMLLRPVASLVLFAFPVAAMSLLIMLLFPGQKLLLVGESSAQLSHILLSMLTYSFICLAVLQSILVVAQEALLRRHQQLQIIRILPPLETMERILFQIIKVGFLLLSVLLLLSFYSFAHLSAHSLWAKTLLSILAWLSFAVLLWGRHYKGWRGQLATRWILGGALLLSLVSGGIAWPL